jgi:hypothetical protein
MLVEQPLVPTVCLPRAPALVQAIVEGSATSIARRALALATESRVETSLAYWAELVSLRYNQGRGTRTFPIRGEPCCRPICRYLNPARS